MNIKSPFTLFAAVASRSTDYSRGETGRDSPGGHPDDRDPMALSARSAARISSMSLSPRHDQGDSPANLLMHEPVATSFR